MSALGINIFLKKDLFCAKKEVLRVKLRVKIMICEIGETSFDVVSPTFEEILMTFEVVFAILGVKKGGNCVVSSLYYKVTTFSREMQICFDLCYSFFSLL